MLVNTVQTTAVPLSLAYNVTSISGSVYKANNRGDALLNEPSYVHAVLHRRTHTQRHTHTPFSHTSTLFRVCVDQEGETGAPRESHIVTGRTCKLNIEVDPEGVWSRWLRLSGCDIIKKMEPGPWRLRRAN